METSSALLAQAQDLMNRYPNQKVLRLESGGTVYWIKRASVSKKKFIHRAQRFLACALRLPMLGVTVSAGGPSALRAEVARLRQFSQAGIMVPEVIAESEGAFITHNMGVELQSFLQKTADVSARRGLLEVAARALADLHAKGLVHGRPYLRDMSWDGVSIGFLDLEEDPLQAMSFAQAQARDLWIFMAACARFAADDAEVFPTAFLAYRAVAPTEYEPHLKKLVRLAQPLRKILQKYFWTHVGKDVRFAATANAFLEERLN